MGFTMQRIMIVGCSGSGKSTLARRIGAALGLPVVHLDQQYFYPGWVEKPQSEFDAILDENVAQERWVMDGNYSRTFPRRLPRAQAVIFLDFPTWFCLYRVLKRIITSLGKVRPDSAPGCTERFDLTFLGYVLNYNPRSRPKMLKAMEGFSGEFVRLTSVKQIDVFVEKLSTGSALPTD